MPNDINISNDASIEQATDYLVELKNYTEDHENKISSIPNERNTIIINAFAGPGAGKTTSCLEITEKLKKQGFVTEYVQEYAKELVWDNKLDLLNGSMENQFAILREQLNRIDRLYGKVDFIVTDSPVLLNATYLKVPNEEYIKAIQEIYSHFDNFNYFVERNVDAFETEGRIHNLEQSLQIDDELKDTLSELNLEYNTYNHSTIDNIVQDVIEYKENYSVAALKMQLEKAQRIAEENNLPFSDKFSEGADDEIDPYVYDGSMTSGDFKKMQKSVLESADISKFNVHALSEPKGNIVALASMTLYDAVTINSITINKGENGYYVKLPQKRTQDGNYIDVAHPINANLRNRINSVLLSAYLNGVNKQEFTYTGNIDITAQNSVKYNIEKTKNVLGRMDILVNDFVIHNAKLFVNNNGEVSLELPKFKTKDGNYNSLVSPANPNCYAQIKDSAITEHSTEYQFKKGTPDDVAKLAAEGLKFSVNYNSSGEAVMKFKEADAAAVSKILNTIPNVNTTAKK